ncbi:MAG: hypothetical protein CO108_15515 [Deltaproteobacteria bacterium CG_4_9_14_3_um_filter_63_12]|nr:MAG: hypothetical protein CO108_15515 [Deltaproteobacteria bacterium CG_4_9_14_3_um_filter_63_12]
MSFVLSSGLDPLMVLGVVPPPLPQEQGHTQEQGHAQEKEPGRGRLLWLAGAFGLAILAVGVGLVVLLTGADEASDKPSIAAAALDEEKSVDQADEQGAPTADLEQVDERSTPSQPLPTWSVLHPDKPLPSVDAEKLPVDMFNVALTGECSGEARKGKSKGISLQVVGEAANKFGDVIHRATVTGLLYLDFSDEVVILRASSGNGFREDIGSDKPWEQDGAERFVVFTREVDPIYCRYEPREAIAAIHLSVETPLGSTYEGVVWSAPIDWSMIKGTPVDETASLLLAGKAKSELTSETLSPQMEVHLTRVHRGKALLDLEGQLLGWADLIYLQLKSGQPPKSLESKPTDTLSFERGTTTVTLRGFQQQASTVQAEVSVTNNGEKPLTCDFKSLFLLSTTTTSQVVLDDTMLAACQAKIAPATTISGRVSFALDTGAPLALGFRKGEVRTLHL